MTNKMPVVGKRYRPLQKESFVWAEFKKFSLLNDGILIFCNLQQVCDDGKSNGYYSCKLTDFWERFEELPESNHDKKLTCKKNLQVETALEELKECIKNESTTKYRIIFQKAQYLVDALETEKGCLKCKKRLLNKNKGAKLSPMIFKDICY